MILILLSGHFHVVVFVIVKEVNKLFSFSRHISYTFGRSRVPWKRKNTTGGLKTTLCCSNFMLHHTKTQFSTVMKISNHEKWKHISINKLFLYLFVCKFLMLYYCNFNVEIAIWTYGITLNDTSRFFENYKDSIYRVSDSDLISLDLSRFLLSLHLPKPPSLTPNFILTDFLA